MLFITAEEWGVPAGQYEPLVEDTKTFGSHQGEILHSATSRGLEGAIRKDISPVTVSPCCNFVRKILLPKMLGTTFPIGGFVFQCSTLFGMIQIDFPILGMGFPQTPTKLGFMDVPPNTAVHRFCSIPLLDTVGFFSFPWIIHMNIPGNIPNNPK